MEAGNFKCKTCGALLDALAEKSANGLVECPYCFNLWTIPKKETSPAALSFLRMGEHDLDTGKFDDALSAYKKAAELDAGEPEAYFGMALAEFQIQYLRVEPTSADEKVRLQPICHEASKAKFTDDGNYMRALLKATSEQRAEYERKGAEIDHILAEFSRLEADGRDYNCFLCVKVSGENGKTEDSKDAGYIYDLLQNKGYKPFYSERELRNVTGADYEARILYALVKSECMLVICRNEEYLQTPWVKNEYTRFLKLVNDEEKESDSIALVFYEKPIERLPGKNGKLQGIDFSRREADGKIVDFVEKHTPAARARREAEAQNRNAQAEEIRRQIEEQKKAQQALEEKLLNLQGGGDMQNGALLEELRLAREAREREERAKEEEARRAYLAQFEIEDGVVTKYSGEGGDVVIPDGVTAIGKRAFHGGKALTSVIIPNGVTSIGESAFMNCGEVTSIVIPEGVTTIGDGAFMNCVSLASIVIPEGVKVIGGNAFQSCRFTDITIPNSVTTIKDSAFIDCKNLTSINIPDSVVSIGKGAFGGCSALKSITFGKRVSSIGSYAFRGCTQLRSVTIPDRVQSIEAGLFLQCSNLKSVTLGKGVTSIGYSAFCGCIELTYIEIPDSITSIGEGAFSGCRALKNVTIGNNVKSIGPAAFYGCSNMTIITIPYSVTSIGDQAFDGCSLLSFVTMPKWLAGGIFKEKLEGIFGVQRRNIRFTFTK